MSTQAVPATASVNDPAHVGQGLTSTQEERKAALEKIIPQAWSNTTTIEFDWSQNNRAWGQSLATSLLVQKELGGEIALLKATLPKKQKVNGVETQRVYCHYINILPDGSRMALPEPKFPEGTQFEPPLNADNATLQAYTQTHLATLNAGLETDFASLRDYLLRPAAPKATIIIAGGVEIDGIMHPYQYNLEHDLLNPPLGSQQHTLGHYPIEKVYGTSRDMGCSSADKEEFPPLRAEEIIEFKKLLDAKRKYITEIYPTESDEAHDKLAILKSNITAVQQGRALA